VDSLKAVIVDVVAGTVIVVNDNDGFCEVVYTLERTIQW